MYHKGIHVLCCSLLLHIFLRKKNISELEFSIFSGTCAIQHPEFSDKNLWSQIFLLNTVKPAITVTCS